MIAPEEFLKNFLELYGDKKKPEGLLPDGVDPADLGKPLPGAKKPAAQQPAEPQANQPAAQQPRPAQPRNAGFQRPEVPVITPAVQQNILADAAEQVNDAIGDEMRSRVSQLREMRRMEHEKEIEQIRAQAALERVRQARMAEEMSRGVLDGVLGDGLIDLTGTARRIG